MCFAGVNAFGLQPLRDDYCMNCTSNLLKKKKTIGCIWSYYKIGLKPHLDGLKASFEVLNELEVTCCRCQSNSGSLVMKDREDSLEKSASDTHKPHPQKAKRRKSQSGKKMKCSEKYPLYQNPIHPEGCMQRPEQVKSQGVDSNDIFKELMGLPCPTPDSDAYQPLDFDMSHFDT